MSIYKPLINTAIDESHIKIPARATIYNPNPVTIGPDFSPTKGRWYIENFNPPVYQPEFVPAKMTPNGILNGEQQCPITPILLRNEWETMNTTNAVAFGGYDPYNSHDIASCEQINTFDNGGYMNYKESTKPWSRVFVNATSPPGFDWVMDSHGYGNPWKQPRFNGQKWINI